MSTQAQLFQLIREFLTQPGNDGVTFDPPDYLGAEALAVCIDADWEGECPCWMVRENLGAYLELLAADPVGA